MEPPSVLIILKKFRTDLTSYHRVLTTFYDTILWLHDNHKASIYLEKWLFDHLKSDIQSQCQVFKQQTKCDFVICIGGDGTLLHANQLFQDQPPPIILPFSTPGSLGFLMPLALDDVQFYIGKLLTDNSLEVLQRSRLKCVFNSFQSELDIIRSLDDDQIGSPPKTELPCFDDNEIRLEYQRYQEHQKLSRQNAQNPFRASRQSVSFAPATWQRFEYHVLNEVVLGRSDLPQVLEFEVAINGQYFTKIQADGLLLSTPTGSTAYNMAAGGGMAHPLANVILMTPICPKSLSCRPIILPDSAKVTIRLANRSSTSSEAHLQQQPFVTFDGRNRLSFNNRDYLTISKSESDIKTALPMIVPNTESCDSVHNEAIAFTTWATTLSHCLNWNDSKLKGDDLQ